MPRALAAGARRRSIPCQAAGASVAVKRMGERIIGRACDELRDCGTPIAAHPRIVKIRITTTYNSSFALKRHCLFFESRIAPGAGCPARQSRSRRRWCRRRGGGVGRPLSSCSRRATFRANSSRIAHGSRHGMALFCSGVSGANPSTDQSRRFRQKSAWQHARMAAPAMASLSSVVIRYIPVCRAVNCR